MVNERTKVQAAAGIVIATVSAALVVILASRIRTLRRSSASDSEAFPLSDGCFEAHLDENSLIQLARDVWWMERQTVVRDAPEWIELTALKLRKGLEDLGVEIVDLTGEQYRDGLLIEVLSNQAETDWNGDLEIVETVVPMVRIKGRVRHQGSVIVGPVDDGR